MSGSVGKRLSVCYAAPGHALVSTSGSARNILAAAEALSEWADVTVAFREVLAPLSSSRHEVIAIEPRQEHSGTRDDVAARGLNPLSHLTYLLTLRRFAECSAGSFDLVLEKGWRLSGYLSRAFELQGVRASLIENDARYWNEPIQDPRVAARYLAHQVAQAVAGYCSRRVSTVIAETEELKSALIRERRIRSQRIEVVGLGVDHAHFKSGDQQMARKELRLGPDRLIMLYVGGMDLYHDLSPLLEALCVTKPENVELHLAGDGEYRARYEALAKGSKVPVVFHGQVAHEQVPRLITAADVCLAPYRTEAFHDGEVYFSTLKIPEYMACARAVISVPSGHVKHLIRDGQTGYLVANDRESWESFLAELPDRGRLAEIGKAAAPTVAAMSWRNTAREYLRVSGFSVQRGASGG